MQEIKNLFGGYSFQPKIGGRQSERGDLISYFTEKINEGRAGSKFPPAKISYIAFKVGHLKKLEDLYYLKSICDSEERRGGIWSKVFFGSIKIQK